LFCSAQVLASSDVAPLMADVLPEVTLVRHATARWLRGASEPRLCCSPLDAHPEQLAARAIGPDLARIRSQPLLSLAAQHLRSFVRAADARPTSQPTLSAADPSPSSDAQSLRRSLLQDAVVDAPSEAAEDADALVTGLAASGDMNATELYATSFQGVCSSLCRPRYSKTSACPLCNARIAAHLLTILHICRPRRRPPHAGAVRQLLVPPEPPLHRVAALRRLHGALP
jgi:hypothetical protein